MSSPGGMSAVYAGMEADHWWYRGRRRIVVQLFERFVGRGDRRILDVGCGTGAMLPHLRPFGRPQGIEQDAGLVRLGRERGLNVTVRDFPKETLDDRFDVVSLFDVLEHLPDDRAALAAARSMLAPGGRLVLTVPALPWLWSPHDVAVGHRLRYDRSLLRRRLEASGFTIVHLTHFNTFLMPLAVVYRFLKKSEGHHFSIPPRPANELLAAILGGERSLAAGPGLATGVSLAAVAALSE